MHNRIGLAAAAIAISLALPAAVLAAPAVGSQFAGTWESTDFDGSHQTLSVSAGAAPSVVYQDFYASGCDNHGNPSSHWVGAGRGSVDGDTLYITYHKSGCGRFLQGGYEDWYVYDAGSDTLTDSFDIVWTRSN